MPPEKEATHGLNCPRCGGVVPIPEGQVIVRCPYCEMRSFVRGERGLRRYQVGQRIDRQQAMQALRQFFSSNWAIARDAASRAQVTEAFLVFLPFWTAWGRVAAWAFGEEKVRRGDHSHYEPREVRIVQDMSWNGAACDVGEFGVYEAPLLNQDLEPFDAQALHRVGMVFEPANSFSEANSAAERQFEAQIRQKAGLDRLSQLFVRFFRRRNGLVYYPLWVLRYLHHGRAYQVVVDAHSGQTLYGKAPGNTLYRAAFLVGGMALGAFLAIDAPAFILSAAGDSDNPMLIALAFFIAGAGLMFTAYRRFRYGEQFEYRRGRAKLASKSLENPLESVPSLESIDVKEIEKWLNRLS
jgi:DNA-directed RNA polymerase subunit RPC12/RpoP